MFSCKNNQEFRNRFLPEKISKDNSKFNEQTITHNNEDLSKFWFANSTNTIKTPIKTANDDFVEPMYFKNFPQIFAKKDENERQRILWQFASTLSCSTIVDKELIQFLFQGFEHEIFGWNIAFIFRKLSEQREYLEMIPNSMWSSIFQLLDKKNLKLREQIHTTIIHIMINIFKNKKSLAEEIKHKLQRIFINENDLPKKVLLAILNGLFTIITSETSVLQTETLQKLKELLTNEENLIVERAHAILDYLDDQRTLSDSIKYSFNAQVKSELTATQNTSVSQSEEECIEPTAKFLGLDNLLGKTGHLDQSSTSNVEPTTIETGHNQAWYRGTYSEIVNLQAIAKTGNLKDQDFEYLLTKFKDDGCHFTGESRETIYQMIAEAFRDAAKAQQRISSAITDRLIDQLYETAKVLNELNDNLSSIQAGCNAPKTLQEYFDYVDKKIQGTCPRERIVCIFIEQRTKFARTCSETVLTIARNQESFTETQINAVEEILKIIRNTQVKKDLIEIYKLCALKGHRTNVDLKLLESDLKEPSASKTASYFFFQAAAIQNQIFSDHHMSLLCSVAKSTNYDSETRENCLWAMAYSIKMMPNEQLIPSTIIDDLGEIVQFENDTIQNATVVALCYYVNDSDRSLSPLVLEKLAVVLTKQDHGLINNVLSIFLKLIKQKHRVPSTALNRLNTFLTNNKEFELREKSIWILKYAADNGENFEELILKAIDQCLNDQEFSIRNIAANVFIQYWKRQITENDLNTIESTLTSRMENVLLFFRNNFDREIQNSALKLIENLVENNYKLSDSLLDLIEYCLYDHEPSNATTSIMIIASYSKRNPLRKQTIACLEYLLTIDTIIQSNVIDILKIIVCQQEHMLSEKSINFLGQLLLKSINPTNILILLKHADRYQPLPKTINTLVEQNYFVQILHQSNCSTSLDKAYRRLLSLTDNGIQLSNYVLNSIFSLLKTQVRLLNIILHVTSNGQHLNNEQIITLFEIDLTSNEELLIRIFTNLIRQNYELPKNVIDSLEQFIENPSVQIFIIEIYQVFTERHIAIDQSIINKIFRLLSSSVEFTRRTVELNSRIASFFKAVAENQPNEIDQTYLPLLLQLQQPVAIRKDACLAAQALAKHKIMLNSETLQSIIYLLNNDENIDIQNLLLQILQLARSNNQITDKSILQLLDLIHDQHDDDNNNVEFIKKIKNAIESGLKLYEKHWTKLCHMLYSCDLNLKQDAAIVLAMITANGQMPSAKILSALHVTLLDETINQHTIQLLRKSPLNISSSTIDDLIYLVLFSKQTIVKQIAKQILDYHKNDSRVMKFRLMLTMNKLTTILDDDECLIKMINSKYDHKVRTGLRIVQSMIITQKQVPTDILLSVTSQINTHTDTVLDLLTVALQKDIQFDQSILKSIEDAILKSPTLKTVTLLRLLAEKQFVFQTKTLLILFNYLDNHDGDSFIALEHAAQYQALPEQILFYLIDELSDEFSDIEVVRRSFNIIRQQILKSFVSNPTELLESIRLPNEIDSHRLSQMKSIEQRLGTILTLFTVDHIDLKVFDFPCEQWSREFLCTDLLAECLDKTPMLIISFYHQLTLLEQYKNYGLYNDSRDTILQEFIRKKQTFKLTLSTINQILICLQTTSDKSIEILRSSDPNWLTNMRRFFIKDNLEKYLSKQQYSQIVTDHLIDQLTQLNILSIELIRPFLAIINKPTEILSILEMIQMYKITTNELIQLFANDKYTVDHECFLQQLELIILKKNLLSKWSSPKDKLILIQKNFETMLNNGWIFTKIHHVLTQVKIDEDETFGSVNQFIECLNLLIDYKIDGSISDQLGQIFSTIERKFWNEQVHNLIMDRRFDSTSSEKNLEMLLDEIKRVNQRDFSDQLIKFIKKIDDKFQCDSKISKQNKPINNWTETEIKNWAQHFLQSKTKYNLNDDVLSEMIAVLKRAIYLDSDYHPRLIQILSVLLILDPEHVNGRLLQILTGEGKSSIVSMLAVVKALQGKQVDIVTSSITLAKRDAHARKNFYSMFDLTVAHNNDETTYIQGLKECYNAHIVYGTSSQFQFDILRHEFNLLNTRENRRFDVVIIDEVDSMLIDENNTIARLADHLPGMEWLNAFLCGIWQCVNSAGENIYENKYTIIKKFVTHLNDPHFEIKVPKHLHRFVEDSLPLWIEHAIRAKIEYKLDHHYMIKPDETRTKRITPVDFSNTGVVQCSTTWSDGLHQFLQMKHGLKLTPLTVTTNFLSNRGYFTRYGNQIYGLTGTIGSNEAKDLLNRIYHVDTIIIPPFRLRQHFQLETILTSDDDEWLKSIISTTISHATNKQAVLIICETRLDAKTITKELQRVYRTGTVRLYADNTDAIEANVVSNQIQHGEIIVATNLAGRGTDLKTSLEVEKNGGLHVCLTFLPNNLRVEEQAIGRTSRQGHRGTSQMIVSRNRTLLQLASFYPDYLNKCNEKTIYSIELIRDWRKEAEAANIKRIWDEEIPEIQKKDDLFSDFCQLLKQLRDKNNDSYRLLSVKERWGLWLKSIDQIKQNRQSLERMVAALGLSCVDVPRDGNSFLNCIARHCSGQLTVENIKRKIIEHIYTNKKLYEKFNETDRHWATCRALNINLVILRCDYGPDIYKWKDAKSTCFLGYEVNCQYVSLDTSNIDPTLEESLLKDIETDQTEIQLVELNILDRYRFHQNTKFESLFLTKAISNNLKENFKIFSNEITKLYATDEIFQNPCYLLLEADDIIEKLSSWSNYLRSYGEYTLLMDKAKTHEDAIKRLEQAMNLDSIFAFSALSNRAHFIVDKGQSDTNYKVTAKSYLTQAKQKLEQFIMPQLYMMLIKPSIDEETKQSKELFFDDLNKQIESKIDILQHYHNYINQAIQVIEASQKLIEVQSQNRQIINMSGKLYRQEVNDFIKKHSNTIDLTFHNLTVKEDMCFKTDQAIELLKTLTQDYQHIAINYFDTKLETIEQIMSKASLTNLCLTIQYLDKDQVTTIIGENCVTLTLVASSNDQYEKAIEKFKGTTIIVEMISQRHHLSKDKVLELLKEKNTIIQSISFESLNQTTVNEIVSGLDKIAITLTFPELSKTSTKQICETTKKPFLIRFRNLSRSIAENCINATNERNFTISLCQLTVNSANKILKDFNRNEQDVKSSLTSIASEYMKKDQASEELSAYRNMGIRQFINIQELQPRPWISICVTAGLGAAQILAGVCLAAATCGLGVQLGIGLITEGISDIYYAVKGAISRNFSWKDYAIQKAISLTLLFVTLGCSAISQAAKAAQATSKGGIEFATQTLKGAGSLIKNSARTYATGAITGTAAKTSFGLAVKQVGVVCLETGARELANYSMNSVFPDLLSPLKSNIYDEIQSNTNIQREKEYFDRVLCRALIADIYTGNDVWMQKLEEMVVKILTKENSAFISIASSLASGITNAAVRHANSFSAGGNSYLNWASRLLTVMPAIKGNYEILTITENFFAIFEKELLLLEPQIPTFEYFIQQTDTSISQQTATEIRQLLEKYEIIKISGTINIQLTSQEDPSVRTNQDKLSKSLENIKFSDEKYKKLTIEVLSKYQTMDPRSLKAKKVQKRIVDMLTDQIIAIIHGTMVAPLANYVVGNAINALSEKIQLKFDSKGTIQEQLMQEGAQRYISNLSNDLVEDVKSGKIKIPPDMEEKLNAFIEKSKQEDFQPENPTEELANAVVNGKQGGVIEIAIIAAMTGKSINVIQAEQADGSTKSDADVNVKYTAPQIDKEGKIQDGHYESTDGNVESKGKDDCLYASTLGKTSNTFKDTQDMRMKCAAFILTNPDYIMSIQPAISILSNCSNPIRRRQLMMEGGRKAMTVEERERLQVERTRRVKEEEDQWKNEIPDKVESAEKESKQSILEDY